MSDEIATYLGQKGYTIKKKYLDIKDQVLTKQELEVRPWVPKSSIYKPPSFPVYRESNKKLYVPRFYGIENFGEPEEMKILNGKDINLAFVGKLRPEQLPALEAYLKCAKKGGAGLLELFCGFGKTVLALKVIAELKKKTLVIVHKSFLMDQWKERIKQFLPSSRVGIIQGEIIDIEDKDIVLGMLQSISMKEYPHSLFQEFGLTILDEVHHLSAEVFSRALFKIVTQYMLGLSATMKRKDGLTHVFKMFLGDVIYSKKREGGNVSVRAIKYENLDEEYRKDLFNYRGQIFYAGMINKLCDFNGRSEFILKVLKNLLKEREGQQIMILAQNKSILIYLHDAIQHRDMATVGYYVGGMKKKALSETEKKQIVIATYAMASEGLDIKTLTTLILATPKTDITQAVGRILRKQDVDALVIDIVDQHGVFQRQWVKRRRIYKKSNYKIAMTDVKGYENGEWDIVFKNKINKKLKGKCLISD